MTTTAATILAECVRDLIDAEADTECIRHAAKALAVVADDAEIETDDDEPDAMNGGEEPLWVVGSRKLTVAGVTVAEWTRCSRGHYGSQGQRHLDDSWEVEEDTDGGDRLPEEVELVLIALGLDDSIPDVPEPAEAEESEDGEYAVLHKNDYAVSGGRDTWGVVSRHATEEEAAKACEAMWRGFSAATTEGSYGPEWCVGALVTTEDGKQVWEPIGSDDE